MSKIWGKKRIRGQPAMRWITEVEKYLMQCSVDYQRWNEKVRDRKEWKATTKLMMGLYILLLLYLSKGIK